MKEERKGLCFDCDKKYNKGHKYGEKKLFYIDIEEEEDQELELSKHIEIEETSSTISCHALFGINNPQTFKIKGYIKNKKVIVLIDFGGTHNFINCKLMKLLNLFLSLEPKFQVMISYGGTVRK
jgi:hypothetical protein